VTFGPSKEKDLKKKVNKKEKQAALSSALSAKHDDDELLLVNELSISEPSAGAVRDLLDNLGDIEGFTALAERANNTALFILPTIDQPTALSFRNFGNIELVKADDVNALDLLTYKFTVIVDPSATVSILSERVAQNQPA
jgi:large subunit ribosomal protein L4